MEKHDSEKPEFEQVVSLQERINSLININPNAPPVSEKKKTYSALRIATAACAAVLLIVVGYIAAGGLLPKQDQREDSQPTPAPQLILSPIASKSTLEAEEIERLVNEYRVGLGLPALPRDDATCEFAEIRAKETSIDWSHEGFVQQLDDGSFLKKYPTVSLAGENLAKEATSNEHVVYSWSISQSHQEAMVDSRWTHSCVAVYYEGGVPYIVQIFIINQ